ncbi:uncharacterized protein RCC_07623 [Ramularia collo-cygni]|uniref:Uncharacterized protein n=1 Tax=Ramularia collo-cygni TaxID=112498 RepID=A0A2D3VIC8_9PEZI|nr:uncharacterized protein RCC_07623 [Ramularia collo-cygni]CZT21759.1 uncharacterized protein RCC_07623 [Ramularia collo-cygni]
MEPQRLEQRPFLLLHLLHNRNTWLWLLHDSARSHLPCLDTSDNFRLARHRALESPQQQQQQQRN